MGAKAKKKEVRTLAYEVALLRKALREATETFKITEKTHRDFWFNNKEVLERTWQTVPKLLPISISMRKRILDMRKEGKTGTEISLATGIARNRVASVLFKARQAGDKRAILQYNAGQEHRALVKKGVQIVLDTSRTERDVATELGLIPSTLRNAVRRSKGIG